MIYTFVTPHFCNHTCIVPARKCFGTFPFNCRHSWDSYLTDILGAEYQFLDNVTKSRATVQDLLLHRTGVPRYDYVWIAGVYQRNELLR